MIDRYQHGALVMDTNANGNDHEHDSLTSMVASASSIVNRPSPPPLSLMQSSMTSVTTTTSSTRRVSISTTSTSSTPSAIPFRRSSIVALSPAPPPPSSSSLPVPPSVSMSAPTSPMQASSLLPPIGSSSNAAGAGGGSEQRKMMMQQSIDSDTSSSTSSSSSSVVVVPRRRVPFVSASGSAQAGQQQQLALMHAQLQTMQQAHRLALSSAGAGGPASLQQPQQNPPALYSPIPSGHRISLPFRVVSTPSPPPGTMMDHTNMNMSNVDAYIMQHQVQSHAQAQYTAQSQGAQWQDQSQRSRSTPPTPNSSDGANGGQSYSYPADRTQTYHPAPPAASNSSTSSRRSTSRNSGILITPPSAAANLTSPRPPTTATRAAAMKSVYGGADGSGRRTIVSPSASARSQSVTPRRATATIPNANMNLASANAQTLNTSAGVYFAGVWLLAPPSSSLQQQQVLSPNASGLPPTPPATPLPMRSGAGMRASADTLSLMGQHNFHHHPLVLASQQPQTTYRISAPTPPPTSSSTTAASAGMMLSPSSGASRRTTAPSTPSSSSMSMTNWQQSAYSSASSPSTWTPQSSSTAPYANLSSEDAIALAQSFSTASTPNKSDSATGQSRRSDMDPTLSANRTLVVSPPSPLSLLSPRRAERSANDTVRPFDSLNSLTPRPESKQLSESNSASRLGNEDEDEVHPMRSEVLMQQHSPHPPSSSKNVLNVSVNIVSPMSSNAASARPSESPLASSGMASSRSSLGTPTSARPLPSGHSATAQSTQAQRVARAGGKQRSIDKAFAFGAEALGGGGQEFVFSPPPLHSNSNSNGVTPKSLASTGPTPRHVRSASHSISPTSSSTTRTPKSASSSASSSSAAAATAVGNAILMRSQTLHSPSSATAPSSQAISECPTTGQIYIVRDTPGGGPPTRVVVVDPLARAREKADKLLRDRERKERTDERERKKADGEVEKRLELAKKEGAKEVMKQAQERMKLVLQEQAFRKRREKEEGETRDKAEKTAAAQLAALNAPASLPLSTKSRRRSSGGLTSASTGSGSALHPQPPSYSNPNPAAAYIPSDELTVLAAAGASGETNRHDSLANTTKRMMQRRSRGADYLAAEPAAELATSASTAALLSAPPPSARRRTPTSIAVAVAMAAAAAAAARIAKRQTSGQLLSASTSASTSASASGGESSRRASTNGPLITPLLKSVAMAAQSAAPSVTSTTSSSAVATAILAPIAPAAAIAIVVPKKSVLLSSSLIALAKRGSIPDLQSALFDEFGPRFFCLLKRDRERVNGSGENRAEFLSRTDANGSNALFHAVWHNHGAFIAFVLDLASNSSGVSNSAASGGGGGGGGGSAGIGAGGAIVSVGGCGDTLKDHQNIRLNTIMHLAVERGHGDIVRMLLSRGANPTLINSQGLIACQMKSGAKEVAAQAGNMHAMLEEMWHSYRANAPGGPALSAVDKKSDDDSADVVPPTSSTLAVPSAVPAAPLHLSLYTPDWLAILSNLFEKKHAVVVHTASLRNKVRSIIHMGMMKGGGGSANQQDKASETKVETTATTEDAKIE